jgi:hypothetical protein
MFQRQISIYLDTMCIVENGVAAAAPKTPVATAMAGAQTTINNQLKVSAATATETATMTATMAMIYQHCCVIGSTLVLFWYVAYFKRPGYVQSYPGYAQSYPGYAQS